MLQKAHIIFPARGRAKDHPVHILLQRRYNGLPLLTGILPCVEHKSHIALLLQGGLQLLYHNRKVRVGDIPHQDSHGFAYPRAQKAGRSIADIPHLLGRLADALTGGGRNIPLALERVRNRVHRKTGALGDIPQGNRLAPPGAACRGGTCGASWASGTSWAGICILSGHCAASFFAKSNSCFFVYPHFIINKERPQPAARCTPGALVL